MKIFVISLFLAASFSGLGARNFAHECVIDESPRELIFCSGDKKYRTHRHTNRTEFIGRCKCPAPKPAPEPKPAPKKQNQPAQKQDSRQAPRR